MRLEAGFSRIDLLTGSKRKIPSSLKKASRDRTMQVILHWQSEQDSEKSFLLLVYVRNGNYMAIQIATVRPDPRERGEGKEGRDLMEIRVPQHNLESLGRLAKMDFR